VRRLEMSESLRRAWGDLMDALARDDHAVLVPVGVSETRWTAYAAIDPESSAYGAWAAAVDEDFVATFDGPVPDNREAAFDAWVCANDTMDWYRDLDDHVSGLNGFLAGATSPFRFNGYVRPVHHSPFGFVITESTVDLDLFVRDWVSA